MSQYKVTHKTVKGIMKVWIHRGKTLILHLSIEPLKTASDVTFYHASEHLFLTSKSIEQIEEKTLNEQVLERQARSES